MPMSVQIGAVAIGLSIPLIWWSVASARGSGRRLMGYTSKRGEATTDMRELTLAESAGSRVVLPAVRAIVTRLRHVTPAGWLETIQRRITLAGVEATWPIERVLAVQVLCGAAGFGLGMLVSWGRLSASGVVFPVVLGILAIWLPSMILDRKAQMRQDRIRVELPDALDQITMSVEAGLGFEGALQRVARAGQGPLAAELFRTLKEMQIGVSRSQALRSLSERSDVGDLHNFVVSVVQAEEYGLPIAQVLRVQAAELRSIRRQRAEERAMKLPVKLIFPMGLCIFPALFIVLIGPGVIRIWRALVQ